MAHQYCDTAKAIACMGPMAGYCEDLGQLLAPDICCSVRELSREVVQLLSSTDRAIGPALVSTHMPHLHTCVSGGFSIGACKGNCVGACILLRLSPVAGP